MIDVNRALLDSNGDVRGELYLGDSLHYKPDGYVLLTGIFKPVLARPWKER